MQVALLKLFELPGLVPVAAYALALAVAVQFNFVVSQLLVWHDRPVGLTARRVFDRWVSFHAWIAFSLVVNLATFAIAQLFVSDIFATVLAVATSTVIKFVLLDRLTFRPPPP